MDSELVPPRNACVDLTLIWGAESFLSAKPNAPADPWGERSFRHLVDVTLGSADVFVPIPADDNDATYRALASALKSNARLSDTKYRSGSLLPETEASIAGAFRHIVSRLRSRAELAAWLRFQLGAARFETYPDSAADHRRQPITDGGAAAWTAIADEVLRLASGMPLDFAEDEAIAKEYAVREHARSLTEFKLLYAFDLFRRGWQYAAFAAENGSTYFPHALRDECLESRGAAWTVIERMEALTFSWSRYFVHLVAVHPEFRSSKAIGELLRRVRDAMSEEKELPWAHFDFRLSREREPSNEELEMLQETVRYVNRVAVHAQLPLIRAEPPVELRGLSLVAERVVALLIDANPVLSPAKWLVEGVVKALKMIPEADVWMTQKQHAVKSAIFKGQYSYESLAPPLEQYELPATPRY